MKKLQTLLAGLFVMVACFGAKAQTTSNDFFAGKWTIVLKGLPDGDKKMIFNLERKDGKLVGAALDPAQNEKEITKFTKVDEAKKSITVYFTASGTDVYVLLEKEDDDHLTGNLLDIFDVTGERIKK